MSDLNITNWWQWLWKHHQKTLQILHSNWKILLDIADVFLLALNTPNCYIGDSWFKKIAWKAGPSWLRPCRWDESTSIVSPKKIFKVIGEEGIEIHDDLLRPIPLGRGRLF